MVPRTAEHRDDWFRFGTDCWRGYVGAWAIENGRFYLVDLHGLFMLVGDDPLFADWFSGVLRVPQGELIQYVHMGVGSVFERERAASSEKVQTGRKAPLDWGSWE